MTNQKSHPDWLTDEGLKVLNSGYLRPGESVNDMYRRAARTSQKYMPEVHGLEEDIYESLHRGFWGMSSPVASNFGTPHGLPVSCYSLHIEDSVSGIYSQLKHGSSISKNGGGLGAWFGDIRPSGSPISGGGKSTGLAPWIRTFDQMASVVAQSGIRRGSVSPYLQIDHPDLPEILRAKDHTTGDPSQFIFCNIGVTVTDRWMESMLSGDLDKLRLFGNVIESGIKTGSPYIVFIDNVNSQNPQQYRDRGLKVTTSNLCSEIMLYTDTNHTFICTLSSLNLRRWDEWKDWRGPHTGFSVPELITYFLDTVTDEFIKKSKRVPSMGRATRSAIKSRAIGIGSSGYHALLQSRGLPFKSQGARSLNIQVQKFINSESLKASRKLAELFGEPEWCVGSGERMTHRGAVAPNRSSSVIMNSISQSCEPMDNNYHSVMEAKGSFTRKNPYLEELLESRGQNTPEVWESILENLGSVSHLSFLSNHEKDVFKTAREIDQYEIVKQTADRQKYICQGQSMNIFLTGEESAEELLKLHVYMWKSGVKSRYYLRSQSSQKKAKVREGVRAADVDESWFVISKDGCPYCDDTKEELTRRGKAITVLAKDNPVIPWQDSWTTFPQIFKSINGELQYVGGFEDLMEVPPEGFSECAACEG